MTPLPKRGFGPPLVRYVFHKNPRLSRIGGTGFEIAQNELLRVRFCVEGGGQTNTQGKVSCRSACSRPTGLSSSSVTISRRVKGGGLRMGVVRRPTMEPFFVKKNTVISSFLSLEFWCSEGHLAQFDLMLTLFRPIPTHFKPFCRADLTCFHLFQHILPRGPDLFSPIWNYFVSQ